MSPKRACRHSKLIRPVGWSDEDAVDGIVRAPSVEFDVIKDDVMVRTGYVRSQLGIERHMLCRFKRGWK